MLAAGCSICVGVRRIFCRAGNSVKMMTQVAVSPTATQMPISKIGRMSDTARAPKPTAVAKIDAVQATNLLSSANTRCSSIGRSGGRSTKRDWM
jgi:hypothetical protein